MDLDSHYLSQFPDALGREGTIIRVCELRLLSEPVYRSPFSLFFNPTCTVRWFRCHAAYLPILLWCPHEVQFQFDGEDVKAGIEKFGDPRVRHAITAAVDALPPPTAYPSNRIAIGDVYGKTFYVSCHALLRAHKVCGWKEIYPQED